MILLSIIAVIFGIIAAVVWKTNYSKLPTDDIEPLEPVKPEPTPLPEPVKPEPPKKPMQTETGEQLYAKSKSLLGQELTPGDEIPDVVGCVANLQEVYRRTTGRYIGNGSALYSTKALKDWMLKDKNFTQPSEPLPGDILVYPTGEGNGNVSNGHCFVVGKRDWMSNNSFNGLWSADFTEAKARAFYEKKGGFTPYIFRPV